MGMAQGIMKSVLWAVDFTCGLSCLLEIRSEPWSFHPAFPDIASPSIVCSDEIVHQALPAHQYSVGRIPHATGNGAAYVSFRTLYCWNFQAVLQQKLCNSPLSCCPETH